MNREDLLILILGLLLVAGMLFTIFFGGEESRHGVGSLSPSLPAEKSSNNAMDPTTTRRYHERAS